MSILTRFPPNIFREVILSEFVEIEDIARFEVAVSHRSIRACLQVRKIAINRALFYVF